MDFILQIKLMNKFRKIIESPIALIGTRYMKEEDFSDPIRIVAKKKIVVPNPIAPTDIIKKWIQNVKS